MRTDLAVPFAEKDQAKALGARWDPARKIWYVTDPADLAPFARWRKDTGPMGTAGPVAAPAAAPAKASANVKAKTSADAGANAKAPFKTPRTDLSLPDHGDDSVAPWQSVVSAPSSPV